MNSGKAVSSRFSLSDRWGLNIHRAPNTVPAAMLTAARVAGMKPDALILDLASAPGGTDFEAARAFGIRALTAPGLPGKWSPQTAAEAVRDAVYNILEDEKA